MHYNTLQKIKTVALTIEDDIAYLPNDFVSEVLVGIEVGDKVRPIGAGRKINPKPAAGVYTEAADYIGSHPYNWAFNLNWFNTYYTPFGEFKGKLFGKGGRWVDSYKILRDEGIIRFNNRSAETELLLIYLSTPESVSNTSVIHPFAEEALLMWISWQVARHDRNTPYIEIESKKRDYDNAYRVLRGMMNKMTTTEIIRSVRRGYRLANKN